ncbi:(ZYRO0E06820g) [Zygosaccharomyces parabailii]|uniref:BN860_05886g1_1 n=1 Tax=Zygosaccharomyces bailii (strain CLIB 213 / ATCC 58445 / CBS 680 / BCRC 21525 / NBRC 1098 / NCYC 1416 / NRRL Y-2227) TaxID=1333698 RepID=A0A8J2T4F3_ZYGB2|nr:(ZYRO0E06820g) [Zygosaccharomyces parabailii]CDF88260.1 BN860_05886g1_1 [Zygosaccharomyces bailii CLIB 213]SJM81795.1 uncharacterized protein ZBIST_0123 [Zygosaccharomyces bailii]
MKSSMVYVETDRQRRRRTAQSGTSSRSNQLHRTFWSYYIHLPYYLLSPGESLWLHGLFLFIASLGLFAVVKYCSPL